MRGKKIRLLRLMARLLHADVAVLSNKELERRDRQYEKKLDQQLKQHEKELKKQQREFDSKLKRQGEELTRSHESRLEEERAVRLQLEVDYANRYAELLASWQGVQQDVSAQLSGIHAQLGSQGSSLSRLARYGNPELGKR